jgi:hypothetical protein
VTEVTLLSLSLPNGAKIGIVIALEVLFAPIAAQVADATSASVGAVSFSNVCSADLSKVTSVEVQSVNLVLDTATVAFDTADYNYYTETNTALWGVSYDYGQMQNLDCTNSNLTGTMTLTRGPFIASSGAQYSETPASGGADFVQFVGNLNLADTAYSFTNNCGNTTVPNLNISNPCDFLDSKKQADWPAMYLGTSQIVRTGVRSGIPLPATGEHITSGHAATIFIVMKAKKSVVESAPAHTKWISSETFTITSA